MSRPLHADSVKLVASVFSSDGALINETIGSLVDLYGPADYVSELISFSYTDYYEKEMGAHLQRKFVAFENLVRPELLPDVKLNTNKLESHFESAGKRKVNIDPGYISHAHLILATGKGFTHRPYLRDGIYADLTLMFRDKAFHVLPWTYPDYADGKTRDMFKRIRDKYVQQTRNDRINKEPFPDGN